MAKTDNDDIAVELYVPVEKPGKYDAHVRKLIAADENRTPEQVKAGAHNSTWILIPTTETVKRKGEEVQVDALPKYKRFFQDSARVHDRTAREIESVDQGDGTTAVRFIVIPKIAKPRKPKTGENVDVPETVDAA